MTVGTCLFPLNKLHLFHFPSQTTLFLPGHQHEPWPLHDLHYQMNPVLFEVLKLHGYFKHQMYYFFCLFCFKSYIAVFSSYGAFFALKKLLNSGPFSLCTSDKQLTDSLEYTFPIRTVSYSCHWNALSATYKTIETCNISSSYYSYRYFFPSDFILLSITDTHYYSRQICPTALETSPTWFESEYVHLNNITWCKKAIALFHDALPRAHIRRRVSAKETRRWAGLTDTLGTGHSLFYFEFEPREEGQGCTRINYTRYRYISTNNITTSH